MIWKKFLFVVLWAMVLLTAISAAGLGQTRDIEEFKSLFVKCEKLQQAGRYREALPLAQRALQIAEKLVGPRDPVTAIALNKVALLYKETGAYEKALPLYQRALTIAEKSLRPGHPDTALYLNNLAGLYKATGAYDKALPLYLRALQITEKNLGPEHADTAHILNSLARLYNSMGDYNKALSLHQRALRIAEKTLGPDNYYTATCLSDLASLYQAQLAYDKALPLAQRALQINEKALGPDHPYTAASRNNLAVLYSNLDAPDKALPVLQRASNIAEKSLGPNHPDNAKRLSNQASIYQDIGAYDKALPLFQRALQINENVLGPEHPDTALGLNNLAGLYVSMGAYDQALPLFQLALHIQEKVLGREHPDTVTSLHNLGGLYLIRKDYSQAKEYFKKGKDEVGLTELYLATSQPAKALELLVGLAPSLNYRPAYNIQFFTQQGLALEGVGRRGEGAAVLVKAVQEIERLRSRVKGERTGFFQAGFSGGYLRSYRGLVATLGEMAIRKETLPADLKTYGEDPGAAAFYFAEATKGRVLLETMVESARHQASAQIPGDLARKEQDLLNRLGAVESRWEKNYIKGGEALTNFQKQREDLQRQLDELVARLRATQPRYAALKYPQPLRPKEVPLKQNEVLLEYALGEKASYLFRVEPEGVTRVFPLAASREDLEGLVKTFIAPLHNKKTIEGFSTTQGQKLYALLLEAALKDLPAEKKLIIVPDGILGLLPFEALIIKTGQNYQDSLYVGDKWQISYSQSAAILALNRLLQGPEAAKPLLAIGNPIFSEYDPRYPRLKAEHSGPSPLPAQDEPRSAHRALASHRDWGKTTRTSPEGKELVYKPLPYTGEEVKAIAGLYQVKPEPPDILLLLKANKTELYKSSLKSYRYLHFSTHADLAGKVQGVNEPFILLGQVDKAPGDDGYLRMSEVFNWQLQADMVVLSACKTGQGEMMAGEGVANFARAFQQAGSKSVLVSLWQVTDQPGMEYMKVFYGHLKAGKSRSEALRLARQEIKAKYPNPFYWAVFILHGEG